MLTGEVIRREQGLRLVERDEQPPRGICVAGAHGFHEHAAKLFRRAGPWSLRAPRYVLRCVNLRHGDVDMGVVPAVVKWHSPQVMPCPSSVSVNASGT